jgi:magnesium chelatase family protein
MERGAFGTVQLEPALADTISSIRVRVIIAPEPQRGGSTPKARLTVKEIDKHAAPDAAGEEMLKQAISRLVLSARGHQRIVKITRMVADPAGAEQLTAAQVAEAVQYRGTA